MALSEQEEFELLSLERERAMAPAPSEPNQLAQTGVRLARGLFRGGPLGLAVEGTQMGMEGLDKAADIAGGAVTDTMAGISGKRSVLNPLGLEIPPEVSGAVGAVTRVGIPAIVGGTGTAGVGKPVMEAGAKRLMHSALKPDSKAIVSGDAAKAIQTMLDEGANVSTAGAAKMRHLINRLHADVAKKIATSPATVDKAHAASEVFSELARFRKQVNPGADTKAILNSWDEFNRLVGAKIPVQQAQELKQGTYRVLAEKYASKHAVDDEAGTQAQMALARGLRKGIEEAVPGVGQLNAREAALINALELAEKRTGIAGNRDIAGIAWLAQHPAAAAAMLADRSPAFKSALARLLHRGRTTIPAGSGAVTAATVSEGQQ